VTCRQISPAELHTFCAGLRYDDQQQRQDDGKYLMHYVTAAQGFTADAAARGHGIIYLIG
jgi:hypothetical protein